MNRPQTHHIDAPRGTVDERWIRDWVRYGFEDMGAHLANQSRFAEYLRRTGRVV